MSNAIDTYPSSVTLFTHRLTCDHGNCANPVTAVVTVTSGPSQHGRTLVEVRTACDLHVEDVHRGWSNKRVAVLHVG